MTQVRLNYLAIPYGLEMSGIELFARLRLGSKAADDQINGFIANEREYGALVTVSTPTGPRYYRRGVA